MTPYGVYVFIVCLLVGGAVFAYRNRTHRLLCGYIRKWWKVFATATGISITVGVVGGVSPQDVIAGLIVALILGFFAKEIGVYLWRGIKYLTKFAFRESVKSLKIKKGK